MTKTNILAALSSLATERVVVTSRLNTGYWYTPAWKRTFRILNLGTTRVLTNSEAGRTIVAEAEHLDRGKIDIYYQGVNVERFRPGVGDATVCIRLGIPESAPVIGIVANLRPVKDLPLFLRAAKIVAERVPQAAFLMVGHGEQLGELQALAKNSGLVRESSLPAAKAKSLTTWGACRWPVSHRRAKVSLTQSWNTWRAACRWSQRMSAETASW